MKINVICVGKLKEDYYRRAQAEYVKMLGRFCGVSIVELPDEPLAHIKSAKDEQTAKAAEGKRVLEKCAGYVIACDRAGKKMSSEAFSGRLAQAMQAGVSEFSFVAGGSLGLSPDVIARADLVLSFSDMTFPHRLFRVVLLEQIYRAFKILRGETYHK